MTAAAPGARSPLQTVLAPVRGALAVAVVLQVVSSLAGLVPLLAIVELARTLLPALDGAAVDADRAWLVVAVSGVALLVRLACLMAAALLTHIADLRVALAIRTDLVRHLGRLPLGWFSRRSSGRVRKTVVEDVESLHVLVAHAALEITAAVVVPVASIAYLLTVDWRLTVVTLVPPAVAVTAYALAMRGAMTKYAHYEHSLGVLAARAVEFVHGIAVVKAFGAAGRAHERFRRAGEEFATFFRGWVRETNRASLVVELGTAPATTLFVVLLGAMTLVSGTLGPPLAPVDVLPFLLLGLGLGAPVFALSFGMQKLRDAHLAAGRLAEVLDTPPLPVPAPGTGARPEGRRVAVRDATFRYDPDADGPPAVDGVDLELRPGTITALVGRSGSGKSTLARLVPRFVDVDAGVVRLGGADVRDVEPDDLYRQVGFVFQDVELLRTSVRENIALARPDADLAAVRAAATAARIDDRIDALPRGYDSVVGDDARLSGGEAQRVAIARALLADAPVLVLDEATAFADPDSEAAIQDALSHLVADRTILVIAHRLHTLTRVDRIVVLDAGRIVETGTHDELVVAGGLYADLWSAAQGGRGVATGTGAHA